MGSKSAFADLDSKPATPAEVRAWAVANGHDVRVRGRLSRRVLDAFVEATGRELLV